MEKQGYEDINPDINPDSTVAATSKQRVSQAATQRVTDGKEGSSGRWRSKKETTSNRDIRGSKVTQHA